LYNQAIGSRFQVFNGTAHHTKDGLRRQDLYYNPHKKRIVSMAKHRTAKKEQRLLKYNHAFLKGKGKFGTRKISDSERDQLIQYYRNRPDGQTRRRRGSRRRRTLRGGSGGATATTTAALPNVDTNHFTSTPSAATA
jgi:hypothetical protein